MKLNRHFVFFEALVLALVFTLTGMVSRLRADSGTCNGAGVTLPFADVGSSGFFCQIAEAYFSGLTSGTSAVTFSPGNTVTREQMAAFITRAQDSALRRGSRRAALDQYWAPTSADGIGLTGVGSYPVAVKSDGADLWVANAICLAHQDLERRSSVRSPTVREGALAAPSLTVGLLTPLAVIQILVCQAYSWLQKSALPFFHYRANVWFVLKNLLKG